MELPGAFFMSSDSLRARVIAEWRGLPEAAERKPPPFDAITIHDNDHPGAREVSGHHIRLIAGLIGPHEDTFAVRYHQRVGATALGQPAPKPLSHRVGSPFVPAGENRHFSATLGQYPGHFHHDRGLPRSPDS